MIMENWKEKFMMILAVVIVLGTLGAIILLMKWDVPSENTEALYLVLGAFIASFSSVVNYFFGSSKGSSDKTQMLKDGK
jgi:FtsH-binding integral membrane protein